MKVEELVYGFKGNETYLTLYFSRMDLEDFNKLQPRAGVYMIYSKENELMYIGETTSLIRRVRNHLTPNWGKKELNKDTVGHIEYAYINEDRYERGIIEGLLVQKYRPALNCNDEMCGDSLTKIPKEVQQDAVYYARNTDIRPYIIARALNVDNAIIANLRNLGTFNHLELPEGYTPKVVITQEFIDNAVVTFKHVSQTAFNQIREMLEEGSMKHVEIARKFAITPTTVSNIHHLKTTKFKKMEEARTGKAVA